MDDPIAKARGEAKRAFIAYAHRMATEVAGTSEMIKGRLNLLQNKEIDEWTCLEGILNDMAAIHVEVSITQLVERFVIFQQSEYALFVSREK